MALPFYSLDQVITQLRTSWGGSAEGTFREFAQTDVRYSIDLTTSGRNGEHLGAVDMPSTTEQRAVMAFERWDELININLIWTSTEAAANIKFDYSTNMGSGTAGLASPTLSGGTIIEQKIWMNANVGSTGAGSVPEQSSYEYKTMIHEIGHALGLSHPGSYNGSGMTYSTHAEFAQDTRRYSVMSYFDANADNSGTDHVGQDGRLAYASTPLLYDIVAIQAIYGADMTTRTTDTTYGFSATAGSAYSFTSNPNAIFCIWDAGGTDTINASGYTTDQQINLNAGTFSSTGYMKNNISIAYNCTIENVVGGKGNDLIYTNSVTNVVDGGDGEDTVVLSEPQSSYRFQGSANMFTCSFGGVTDTIIGIEYVRFGTSTTRIATSSLVGRDDNPDTFNEPNGVFKSLAVGLNFGGSIETGGDRDVFKFNAVANDTYQFVVSGPATASDFNIRVLDATGRLIASNNDFESFASYSAIASGLVYVEVSMGGTNTTGTYSITTREQIIPPATDDFRDTIFDTSTPFGNLTVGGSTSGAIETDSDKDIFAVTLLKGKTYTVDLKGAALDDPSVTLFSRSGVALASNDDFGGTLDSHLTFTARKNGRFYIEASSAVADDTGDYQLSIRRGFFSADPIDSDVKYINSQVDQFELV